MQIPECTTIGCGGFFGRNKVNTLERNIFLLMLGLDNSGKTCTAKSLVGEPLSDVTPTIGFAKVMTKYKGFKVTLFDLGGSKSFRGIW
jgi:GTPase SAR1 family protein